jgi:EAL domain-containing protein (putative c-di-GMP-specific phosphodiesterase class I)
VRWESRIDGPVPPGIFIPVAEEAGAVLQRLAAPAAPRQPRRLDRGLHRRAWALGMTTVVEGVEDLAQLDFLRRHGCPLAQGFLLGRPVSADQLERRLVGSGPNAAR